MSSRQYVLRVIVLQLALFASAVSGRHLHTLEPSLAPGSSPQGSDQASNDTYERLIVFKVHFFYSCVTGLSDT